MSDNRKYYYLKLKENYFDDDSIVLLESMQDGILYSYILLKLYLKSLKNSGKLQLDESIPYTPQMIATLTRQQVGTVERALKIYLQLGLVEVMTNGAYYMSNIELLIGQSSTEGERKKQARLALQAQKKRSGQMSGHLSDIHPPEIEKEIEIEIKLEKERELEKGQPARPYGRYQNVILSEKMVVICGRYHPAECSQFRLRHDRAHPDDDLLSLQKQALAGSGRLYAHLFARTAQ